MAHASRRYVLIGEILKWVNSKFEALKKVSQLKTFKKSMSEMEYMNRFSGTRK